MRLFVAVPVPDEVRDAVVPALAGVRGDDRVAWTRPDGWHATVAFLGEVDDGALADVVAAVRVGTTGMSPFGLTTAAVGTLARGTALVVDLDEDPDGAMVALGAAVQESLGDAGFDVARRRVRPHLTLGRARRRGRVPEDVVAAVDVPATSWVVAHLAVVRSVLGDGPATYLTVGRVDL